MGVNMYASKQATAYTSGGRINAPRPKRKKTKGTNIMFKWFAKKIRNAIRAIDYENEDTVVSSRDMVRNDHSSDERITLRLEKAIGGHIVTVTKYNGKIDRHRENTYLVRDDDNLEAALTGVFIQETLSQ